MRSDDRLMRQPAVENAPIRHLPRGWYATGYSSLLARSIRETVSERVGVYPIYGGTSRLEQRASSRMPEG